MNRKVENLDPFPADGFQHYYLRDDNRHPIGVVAITPAEDGRLHRGISILSDDDPWDRELGRKIAVSRCKRAVAKQGTDLPVSDCRDATLRFSSEFNAYAFKSCFNVEPLPREEGILRNLLKRTKHADCACGQKACCGCETLSAAEKAVAVGHVIRS